MDAALVVLGTGGALPTARRDNTALAFRIGTGGVLIDCPGGVYTKLLRAGVDPTALDAVVLTHAHPDHVYGLVSLVHSLWMVARGAPRAPLPLYAPAAEAGRVRALLALFDLDRRAAFLDHRALPDDPGRPFWERGGHRLHAHTVDHGPPACAVRWDAPGGLRVTYSTDTRPLDALAAFGASSDLFVHEATYASGEEDLAGAGGHSTAGQAGRIAALAGARRLLLVHLGDHANPGRWIADAQREFAGPVEIPEDGAVYPLG
ncbi:MAG: MBL fold metallo-hydrolase [Armatimonadota bacterium]|nr:MBL fold metallo-hydrolase [Armatimonadota bacterium]MDR7421201.1 MBL fold metallo-hydrolase [Armatimonadota bacterium]MDR7454504.1 MBL fold metallo-hydrolase [Armatimonadota bacterium]MDR7456719.1 MBL fold metallo-hydrolase [Armatimonadota bacterium]MDR7496205.1 MBL fold metallo-hydrolase [Armatimonadota bacterium]